MMRESSSIYKNHLQDHRRNIMRNIKAFVQSILLIVLFGRKNATFMMDALRNELVRQCKHERLKKLISTKVDKDE